MHFQQGVELEYYMYFFCQIRKRAAYHCINREGKKNLSFVYPSYMCSMAGFNLQPPHPHKRKKEKKG